MNHLRKRRQDMTRKEIADRQLAHYMAISGYLDPPDRPSASYDPTDEDEQAEEWERCGRCPMCGKK